MTINGHMTIAHAATQNVKKNSRKIQRLNIIKEKSYTLIELSDKKNLQNRSYVNKMYES